MTDLKPIETEYKGYRFRSRLEARWAVFFDACGIEYEYEPDGYALGNGMVYLPDFLLHGVCGRDAGDLYVEVKGQMTDADAEKINRFVALGMDTENGIYLGKSKSAVLVLGNIPPGDNMGAITDYISTKAYEDHRNWPNQFNFQTIDGDYFAAHPGVNKDGKFELFGDDSNYLSNMDPVKTEWAYRMARQARFEHGEKPNVMGGMTQ